ncbi:MAG: glycosyltransferase, partial [Pirellula sp.]
HETGSLDPMTRIRVLFCSSTMDGGGSERQLLYLLKGLDREVFEPSLYLLRATGPLLDQVPLDCPVTAFWTNRSAPKLNWPGRIHHQQIRHLANHIRSQGIQVVYDRLFHMTMISGPACIQAHCARVSTIVSPPQYDVHRPDNRWRWIKRRRLAKAYSASQALLSVSQGTALAAAKYYGIPGQRFEIVPSPIDTRTIQAKSLEPSLPEQWSRSVKNIIAIGRLGAEKGHAELLEAFGLLVAKRGKQYHLHIAGEGPLRQTLEARIQQLNLTDCAFLHGHLSNPYPLLKHGDLFVLPSRYEGLPNVMLEAMLCGCPILATNTEQGAGEYLRLYPLGNLVPIGDIAAMLRWMLDRFDEPAKWTARAQVAYHHVLENHDLDRWIQRLSGILVRAVETKLP